MHCCLGSGGDDGIIIIIILYWKAFSRLQSKLCHVTSNLQAWCCKLRLIWKSWRALLFYFWNYSIIIALQNTSRMLYCMQSMYLTELIATMFKCCLPLKYSDYCHITHHSTYKKSIFPEYACSLSILKFSLWYDSYLQIFSPTCRRCASSSGWTDYEISHNLSVV